MSSMIIKVVQDEDELVATKGLLLGHGYRIVFEGAAEVIDVDLTKFGVEETSINDGIIVIGIDY